MKISTALTQSVNLVENHGSSPEKQVGKKKPSRWEKKQQMTVSLIGIY
jgi:hypothetical protein